MLVWYMSCGGDLFNSFEQRRGDPFWGCEDEFGWPFPKRCHVLTRLRRGCAWRLGLQREEEDSEHSADTNDVSVNASDAVRNV
jgi:hypothetical protein